MVAKNLYMVFLLAICIACSTETKQKKKNIDSNLIEISSPNENDIVEMYQRFPSVDELLPSLIENDFEFNKDLPIPLNYKVVSNDEKILKILLGMYLADVGYFNLYEKKTESLLGLQAFVNLCDTLDVSITFDKSLLNLMEHKSYTTDSLDAISAKNYVFLIQSFESNDDISTVKALTGGMLIEILYLSMNSIINEDLFSQYMDLIAQQKAILEYYLVYFDRFSTQSELSFFEKDIHRLYGLISKFKIKYVESTNPNDEAPVEKLEFNEETFYTYKNELGVIREKFLE